MSLLCCLPSDLHDGSHTFLRFGLSEEGPAGILWVWIRMCPHNKSSFVQHLIKARRNSPLRCPGPCCLLCLCVCMVCIVSVYEQMLGTYPHVCLQRPEADISCFL